MLYDTPRFYPIVSANTGFMSQPIISKFNPCSQATSKIRPRYLVVMITKGNIARAIVMTGIREYKPL